MWEEKVKDKGGGHGGSSGGRGRGRASNIAEYNLYCTHNGQYQPASFEHTCIISRQRTMMLLEIVGW